MRDWQSSAREHGHELTPALGESHCREKASLWVPPAFSNEAGFSPAMSEGSIFDYIYGLFNPAPAPEPLPFYLGWQVFFGFHVSRVLWHYPLVPRVRLRPWRWQ